MSFGDDDILQDFLVEAGELLEQLPGQLVELEQRPDDHDLLNAIFRGFHTIKGGAGFLQLDALVDCCHITENLFDMLRTGRRAVTSELMDVVLQALDALQAMFAELHAGEEPQPAPPGLLAQLAALVEGGEAGPAATAEEEPQATDDFTDGELEQLLSAVAEGGSGSENRQADGGPAEENLAGGDMTDEEFEALLDQLHGTGRHGGVPEHGLADDEQDTAAGPDAEELIDDAEFEAILDSLHGAGRGPTRSREEGALSGEPPEASPDPAPPPAAAPAQAAPREGPRLAETSVRVDTQRLDDIMNMVGELVLVRNRLVRLGEESDSEDIGRAVSHLDVVTGDLQAAVMKTRMQPIKKVFGRFPRVVRDMARNLDKEITLELRGEDTDLDKNLVEALADPLVHLVRNAVDHGIESPEERERAGKPRAGRIVLSAEQEGDHILLAITDDGAGMDAERLRSKVVEKGLMDQDAAARLSDSECYNLIFMPGFSTKTEVSDVSGRGVGMDVVKTRISQLNGSVDIDSRPGEGTRLSIKVPLTLAIMPTLMVMLGQQTFALPLVNVDEIFHMDLGRTHRVDGREVITVRNRPIPLFHLPRWLVARPTPATDWAHVVIVSVGTQRIGLVVDQLIGQEEVVIKPLGHLLQGTPGMAGATITGDGRIALILDVAGMLSHYGSS